MSKLNEAIDRGIIAIKKCTLMACHTNSSMINEDTAKAITYMLEHMKEDESFDLTIHDEDAYGMKWEGEGIDPIREVYEKWKDVPVKSKESYDCVWVNDMWNAIKQYCEGADTHE